MQSQLILSWGGGGGPKGSLREKGVPSGQEEELGFEPEGLDLAAWAPHLVSSLMRVPDFLLGTHPGPSSQVNRCPRPVPVGQSLNSTLQATEMD